jgi:hypothetical protein
MDDLFKIIPDWLLQGLVIAFIAWIVPKVLEISFEFLSSKNRHIKISRLITKLIKYNSLSGKSFSDDSVFMIMLLFRSSVKLIRGLIWLVLGLMLGFIFETQKSIFSVIGYLGCAFYLFLALEILMPIMPRPSSKEAKKEIQKIKDELKLYPELEGFSDLE